MVQAWEGASASARAPYLSRETAKAAAFAAAVAAAGGSAGGTAAGGGAAASKKRGRSKKKDEDHELEETEAFLAYAARLKLELTSKTTSSPDTDDEDEQEREMETDWGAAPPLAVLGLSPRRGHLLVARTGAPLFAYGLVSAPLAARARAGDPEAISKCPLPPALLDEFEESEAAFARELAARSDGTGGYDLSEIADALCFDGGGSSSSAAGGAPNAATAAPALDSFAFIGAMRLARGGLLGKPLPLEGGGAGAGMGSKKLKRDVMIQVPALALSRLVRRIQVAAAVRLSFF